MSFGIPYLGGVDDLFQFLRHHGVTPLHNANVKLVGKDPKDFFYLVGTDDIFADSVRSVHEEPRSISF